MPTDTRPAPDAAAPAAASCPVADTMRRVHEQLRTGRAPSFEAMLAYGVPEPRAAA